MMVVHTLIFVHSSEAYSHSRLGCYFKLFLRFISVKLAASKKVFGFNDRRRFLVSVFRIASVKLGILMRISMCSIFCEFKRISGSELLHVDISINPFS